MWTLLVPALMTASPARPSTPSRRAHRPIRTSCAPAPSSWATTWATASSRRRREREHRRARCRSGGSGGCARPPRRVGTLRGRRPPDAGGPRDLHPDGPDRVDPPRETDRRPRTGVPGDAASVRRRGVAHEDALSVFECSSGVVGQVLWREHVRRGLSDAPMTLFARLRGAVDAAPDPR